MTKWSEVYRDDDQQGILAWMVEQGIIIERTVAGEDFISITNAGHGLVLEMMNVLMPLVLTGETLSEIIARNQ